MPAQPTSTEKPKFWETWADTLLKRVYGAFGRLGQSQFVQRFGPLAQIAEDLRDFRLRIWISNFLYYLIKMLEQTWSTVLLLAIVWALFTQLEQTIDFLEDFTNKDWNVKLSTYGSALICTLVTWYATRLQLLFFETRGIFEFKPESGADKVAEPKAYDTMFMNAKSESPFVRYTPVVIGSVPLLILMTGFAQVGNGLAVIVTILLLIFYLFLTGPVTNYLSSNGEDDSARTGAASFGELRGQFRLLVYGIWLACGLFFIVAYFFRLNLHLSRFMGMVAVAFVAFGVWIWILSFINILNNRLKPALHLLLAIALVATLVYPNNNNHSVRVMDERTNPYFTKKDDTRFIHSYFSEWARRLVTAHNGVKVDTLPVYLIAAEGGGIRAAYWTAGVLAELEKEGRKAGQFTPHVFSISGVSGGSLGAGLFAALYRDAGGKPLPFDSLTQRFMQQDYLSPLMTAGLGPDMLQKFLFFKWNNLDRAQYLEDGWEREYEELMADSLSFNQSFHSLWQSEGNPTAWNWQVPVLFLNSTHVERGQKAVITPLRFDRNPYFTDVVDIQEQTRRHLALKTAISMSARFPIFTPPAVVNDPRHSGVPIAHYVDGGYIDNSGLETTLAILSTLIDAKTKLDTLPKSVKVHVIFIKNSDQVSDSVDTTRPEKAIHRFYELSDPARAFFNSWDNSVGPKLALTREFLKNAAVRSQKEKQGSIQVDPCLYIIDLERGGGRIPLGWQLSKPAAARIERQLAGLLHRQSGDFRRVVGLMNEKKPPATAAPLPALARVP